MENDKEIAKLEKQCKDTGSKCDEAQRAERDRLKFTFFSAHDTNIAGMIAFMELRQEGFPPPYASTFFFRLLSKDELLTGNEQDYFVEVMLNGAIAFTFEAFSDFVGYVDQRAFKGDLE